MKLLERLNDIGFERPRRAVASLALSLFLSFYLVVALLLALNGMEAFVPVFVALALCYGVASFSVAAEWFWGRWFANGLGWSGLMMVVASLVLGMEPNLIMITNGLLHGLVVLVLSGKTMAARYDEQSAWRERYGMDEFGVVRLRKTVTRAAAALPSVIFYFLAPPQDGQGVKLASLAAVGMTVAGLFGVVRLRTWGLLALASAAVLTLTTSALPSSASRFLSANTFDAGLGPKLAAAFLLAALVPFAGPAARYLGRPAKS